MLAEDDATKTPTASPLLRLPSEIRLMIYEYLLFPSTRPSTTSSTSVANLVPDFHTYYSEDTNNDPFTLSVRTMDPWLSPQGSRTWRRRSTYHVRAGHFLTTTTPTTYRVLLSPYTAHLRHTVPSLLPLNRQIHTEASQTLYSTYTFSFHTSVEAIVPFLSDLHPRSRTHIRHLSLTKKALPYTKEFDRAEWSNLCSYLAAPILLPHSAEALPAPCFPLHTLHLNIIAGRPDTRWDAIAPIPAADFPELLRLRDEGSAGVDLEWAEQLMRIKGLRAVSVKALVEHCARPASEKQAFWVAFSRSVVEGGFGEWLHDVMVRSS
ncbi:hypothetical protein ACN47E_005309 [Coniothyrium glycines]